MEDEKQIELDALQSIYMDQFKPTDNPNVYEVVILANPDAGEAENQFGLVLEVQYTENYPNEVPRLQVRSFRNVPNKKCRELQDQVLEQANELVGMQMIYSLAQFLKDWLDEQNMDELAKQKEKEKMKEEIDMQKEVEEYQKKTFTDGTPVTVETFNAWWPKFITAHPEKPQMPLPGLVDNKLTGKKFFQSMSLSAIAKLAAQELKSQASEGGLQKSAEVDWELFADEAIDDEE